VQEVDLRRDEILDPVLVDRVRVPAADLHDRHVAVGQRLDLVDRPLREPAVPELVDVLQSFSNAMPA
jgi:hypothetical protein